MKKNWAIRKDAEAVSPVIATILMVAITVVLAAVLYVMVLGFGTTTNNTPAATYQKDTISNGKLISIVSITNKEVPWDDVSIQVTNSTGTAVYEPVKLGLDATPGATQTPTGAGSMTVKPVCVVTDLAGNGVVSGGDTISLTVAGGLSGSYTVNFLYEPTGERIGTPVTWT